ncbi:MAG: UDP-2,3-diacylglucosamine diphosphatase [Betaproteobacteria bacterium]|nr:UDP-2,3-diacylglucosamine diphosphatase [Betaproteobacteria bacterium]
MSVLFISDLHLCKSRPGINGIFLDFLAGRARRAQALYILGDLFDYWAGDDDLADALNAAVAEALAQCAAAMPVFLLRGNRDFLIGSRFAAAAGVRLLDEPALIEVDRSPALLAHGDALCTDDVEYQRFRAQVRSPDWINSFLAKPLSERRHEIEALRSQSEREKQRKSAAIMDANAEAVASLLRAHGYPRLIHGHTHRPARHEHIVDGRHCERWVLGAWYSGGSVLVCEPNGWRVDQLGI